MSNTATRNCYKKCSFRTQAKAQAVADKYDQRDYRCPICFCWHCTSLENWRDEFVSIEKYQSVHKEMEKAKDTARKENERRKRLSVKINELERVIKRLKKQKEENS